jgi:hypothetical protein
MTMPWIVLAFMKEVSDSGPLKAQPAPVAARALQAG